MALVTFVDDNAPYLNAQNLNNNFNELNNQGKNSTTETIVGTYNNKPLYRKIISYGAVLSQTWTEKTYATLGISNKDFIYCSWGIIDRGSSTWEGLFCQNNRIQFLGDRASVYLTQQAQDIIMCLEYTKTTD